MAEKITLDDIREFTESEGWRLDYDKYNDGDILLSFAHLTPYGGDRDISVWLRDDELDTLTFEDLADDIWRYLDDFDVSTETMAILDQTGHGSCGAPYDMKDCYEDVEKWLDMAKEFMESMRLEGERNESNAE